MPGPVRFVYVTPEWYPVAVALRDLMRDLKKADINRIFEPTGYVLTAERLRRVEELSDALGQRRALAHEWLERINWTDTPPHGLIEVLERTAHAIQSADAVSSFDEPLAVLNRALAKNGLELDIQSCSVMNAGSSHALPSDLPGVHLEFRRIERALKDGDSLAVIGSCKNLAEATAKICLDLLDVPESPSDRYPQLVGRLETALGDLESAPSEFQPFVRHSFKAAKALSDLRNSTEGSGGHGSHTPAGWIQREHAELIVGMTVTWSRFVLKYCESRRAIAEVS